jgi:hypothetical protein
MGIVMLFWLVWSAFSPPTDPEVEVSAAAASCTYGCLVYGEPGRVYEITREDLTVIGLLAKAESGPRFVRDESAATVWAMVQRFAKLNGQRARSELLSLAQVMRSYSAVLNGVWTTGSKRYHPRITARADSYVGVGWDELPEVWRFFAVEFVRGEVANKVPGCVHVLARGFERHAAEHLIGPFYASTEEKHPGGNAYYQTDETWWWPPWRVQVVRARADLDLRLLGREAQEARGTSGEHRGGQGGT